jgi:hypothetical protein
MTFARFKAIFSARAEASAEWTAPTTQIALLYRKWPGPGGDFKLGQKCIRHRHDRRPPRLGPTRPSRLRLFWRTIIFGLLSACVGIALALADTAPPASRQA